MKHIIIVSSLILAGFAGITTANANGALDSHEEITRIPSAHINIEPGYLGGKELTSDLRGNGLGHDH